jgi:subtilase family serine protease
VLGLAMIAVLMTLAGPARAAGAQASRVGARPPIPVGAQPVGALPQVTSMRATVALAPRDPAALAAYAEAVSTPGSVSYHRYLTVAEFVQRFGPSDAQVDAVRASLSARGLQVGALSANRLALSVGSTAGNLASAFQISFERFRLPSGRLAYANTSAPSIAGNLVGAVQSVVGLDTLATPRPASLTRSVARGSAVPAPQVATGGPQPCSPASTYAAGHRSYTADKLASAYRFSGAYAAGDFGGGVTVALLELEPHLASDISAYQTCYGTNASVFNVPVDGGAGTGAETGEAALDIEDVIGLAPKANVLVYEGPNSGRGPYDTYNAIISQNRAQVISTSWGLCEADVGASAAAAENTLFQEADVQGQSTFAASGDAGAGDCGSGAGASVDDPASQPYVTGVGGTTLSSLGPPPTETVWDNSSGAGGGGVSSLWPMPSYQASAPSSLGVINARSSGSPCRSSGYCREVPDVSADADPNTGYDIYWSAAWHTFGGTSAAAPTWAALTALADASLACAGAKVGFANAAIYRAAAAGYRSDFNDVTSGSNPFNGAPGFTALAGFDMASGLGTPGSLTAALCGSADTVTIASPGPQSATQGTATRLQLNATSSGGMPMTFAAANLPSGLSIDSASGLITGTPDTAGTWAVTVTASDASSSTGAVEFTWSVAVRAVPTAPSTAPLPPAPTPVVTVARPLAQRGRVGVARRLQIAAADSGHLALAYTATGLPAGLRINSSSGLISGTPARATRTTVTVRARDAAGSSATTASPWTIAGRPRVRASSVRLPQDGRARLSVSLLAGAHAAAIKRVVVSVPRDIRISLTPHDRTQGIAAVSPFGVHLSNTSRLLRAALVIRLARGARNATLSLSSPQLSLSRQLSVNLRRRRVRTVKLVVTAIDSAGIRTRLFARATVRLA